MNNPFVREQAAGLAARLIAESMDASRRIRMAHELVYSREPTPIEEENPAAAQAALNQLIELGYVTAPTGDTLRTIERAEAEADFNVAVSLGEAGRVREAKEILAKLTERSPDEPRYWMAFAQMCLTAQTPEQAKPALAALERLQPNTPQTITLRGVIAWARGDMETCVPP